MTARLTACKALWLAAKEDLSPIMESWGFVRSPGRLARHGFDRGGYYASFVYREIYPKTYVITIWVDCKNLDVLIDGCVVAGKGQYRQLSDIDDNIDLEVSSIAGWNERVRLAKSGIDTLRTMSSTYSLRKRGDPAHYYARAKRVTALVARDLEFIRKYMFEGYVGRRVAGSQRRA